MTELTDIVSYLSLGFLVIIGFGLGASTTVEDFKRGFRNPKAVGIGFLSQYLFMPVATYALCLIFQLDTRYAVGAVLIGCSPGGTTSNLFTYWSQGDVALSITMSFLSTAAAFFMMPLWIFLLVKQALESDATIAWANMVIALLLILFPTGLGLFLRKYNTSCKIGGKFLWEIVELFASIMGIIFLIVTIVLSLVAYGDLFSKLSVNVGIMAAIVQPVGCLFGYYAAKIFCCISSGKMRRTISLETGVQNFALSVAIVNLSFEGDDLEYALLFPLVYGFLYLFWSPLIVLFFRYYLAPKDNDEGRTEEGGENSKDTSKILNQESSKEKDCVDDEEVLNV